MTVEKIVVQFKIPFLIRVGNPGSDGFEIYSIPFEEYTAKIGFDMEPGGKGGVTIAAGAEEDRLGNLSSTKVQVVFGKDFIKSIPDDVLEIPGSAVFQIAGGGVKDDKNGYIAKESTRCVNRFVKIYKSVTNSYWMRNLLPHDIFDFILIEVNENGDTSQQRYQHNAGIMSGMGSTIGEKKDNQIREMLVNNTTPSIYTRLQLRVRDEMSLKEYDLAVADSQRLMERWVKEACECLLQEFKGMSRSKAEDITRREDGSFMSFDNIIDQYESKLDFNIRRSKEYDDWYNNVRGLRNDIVHEGYRPTENEAIEAVLGCNELAMYIKSDFNEYLCNDLLAINDIPEDGVGRTETFDDT